MESKMESTKRDGPKIEDLIEGFPRLSRVRHKTTSRTRGGFIQPVDTSFLRLQQPKTMRLNQAVNTKNIGIDKLQLPTPSRSLASLQTRCAKLTSWKQRLSPEHRDMTLDSNPFNSTRFQSKAVQFSHETSRPVTLQGSSVATSSLRRPENAKQTRTVYLQTLPNSTSVGRILDRLDHSGTIMTEESPHVISASPGWNHACMSPEQPTSSIILTRIQDDSTTLGKVIEEQKPAGEELEPNKSVDHEDPVESSKQSESDEDDDDEPVGELPQQNNNVLTDLLVPTIIPQFQTPELQPPDVATSPDVLEKESTQLITRFERFRQLGDNENFNKLVEGIQTSPVTLNSNGPKRSKTLLIFPWTERLRTEAENYIMLNQAAACHQRHEFYNTYRNAYFDREKIDTESREDILSYYARLCAGKCIRPTTLGFSGPSQNNAVRLDGINLSVEHAEIIGKLMERFSRKVTSLYLKDNNLVDKSLYQIVRPLHPDYLQSLYIEGNTFGAKALAALCKFFKGEIPRASSDTNPNVDLEPDETVPRLRHFSLAKCRLTHNTFQDLISSVAKSNCKLEYLNLSGLQPTPFIHRNVIHELADFVLTCETLTSLDLSASSIDFEGFNILFNNFETNFHLRFLNISWNSLHSPNDLLAHRLKKLLAEHEAFTHLDFSYTNLSHSEMLAIMAGVFESFTVQVVHLTGNNFTKDTKLEIRRLLESSNFPVEYANPQTRLMNDVMRLTNPRRIIRRTTSLVPPENQGETVSITLPILKLTKDLANQHPWDERAFQQRFLTTNLLVGSNDYTKYTRPATNNLGVAPGGPHKLQAISTGRRTALQSMRFYFTDDKTLVTTTTGKQKINVETLLKNDPMAMEMKTMVAGEVPVIYFRFQELDVVRCGVWREYHKCFVCEKWRKIQVNTAPAPNPETVNNDQGSSPERKSPDQKISRKGQKEPSPEEVEGPSNMYIYASFTNWKPRLMVYSTEKSCWQYIEYVPPGNHFYIISPNHGLSFNESQLGQATTLFVKPSDTELPISRAPNVRKGRIFVKENSLFKDYIEDTPKLVKQMLDVDFQNSKFDRLIRNPKQLVEFKAHLLSNYYSKLRSAFHYYGAMYNYPYLSQLDFGKICKDLGLLNDGRLNIADIDRAFIATNFEVEEQEDNPDTLLCRFELVEAFYRVAQVRYPELKANGTPVALFTKFMEDVGDKIMTATDNTEKFRKKNVHTVGVNEVLKVNLEMLEEVFKKYADPRDHVMPLSVVPGLLKDAKIVLPSKVIQQAFAFSKMPVVDEINLTAKNSYDKLQFVEFLELLVRIADAFYKDEKTKGMAMHLKLDDMMTTIASLVGQRKARFKDHPDYHPEDENEGEMLPQ